MLHFVFHVATGGSAAANLVKGAVIIKEIEDSELLLIIMYSYIVNVHVARLYTQEKFC